MFCMAPVTVLRRLKRKVFANHEDLRYGHDSTIKPKFGDPEIEICRSAHRDDAENILPFIVAGFFYVLTNPEPFLAINLFRVTCVARIAHSLLYITMFLPQTARSLTWIVCFGSTVYMSVKSALYFY